MYEKHHSLIQTLTPTASETSAIDSIFKEIAPLIVPGRTHALISFAEELGRKEQHSLMRISSILHSMLEHREGTRALVVDVRDLCAEEIEGLGKTPTEFIDRSNHIPFKIDLIRAALIGAAGGYSYSYSSQANGTLADDVVPLKKYSSLSGYSAGLDLGWHTEDASFSRTDDDSCHSVFDVFSFAYLRNPNLDPTLVSLPDLTKLDVDIHAELCKKQFIAKTSISHQNAQTPGSHVSYVYGNDHMRFSFARLGELRAQYEGKEILDCIDAFISFLDASQTSIPGVPGTIGFIDNMRVPHARGSWKLPPRFDGSDRWQRRLGFSRTSRHHLLEKLMSSSEERMIDEGRLAIHLQSLLANEISV